MDHIETVGFEGSDVVAHLALHDVVVDEVARPCWTAVSEGLASRGQAEIAITLVRDSDDLARYPSGVLGYFRALERFATEGRVVESGDVSGFRSPGPFGVGDFVGVAFGPAATVGDLPIGDRTLAGVLITEPELQMGVVSGSRRVLARLGAMARYYPFPYWCDPARTSVYAPGDADATMLARIPSMNAPLSTATLVGSICHLRLSAGDAETVAEALANGNFACLRTGQDPDAGGRLTWIPGQTAPSAITDDLRTDAVAAGFVTLVPSGEPTDAVRFQEDGFSALLSGQTVSTLLSSLGQGQVHDIDEPGGHYALRVSRA